MKKAFTLAAVAALALGAAACHKSADTNGAANVSAEDNMLVPADENASADLNGLGATDNLTADNSAAPADANAAQ